MVRAMLSPETATRSKSKLMRWAQLIFSIAVAAGFFGCENPDVSRAVKVYEVKGSVVLADGKPLTGGTVEFEPVSGSVYHASGEIGSDGTFSLKTADSGDGAAPGEYRVKVVPDEATAPFVTKGKTKTRDFSKLPFARKYLDADTSGLKATVKAEPTELDAFKLSKSSGSGAAPTKGPRD
jgi:hypothetical protein